MKVLVACEFTGIVRDEFSKIGHYAVSCDLIKSERRGKHYLPSRVDGRSARRHHKAAGGEAMTRVAYFRMPLALSAMDAMNRFVEKAYGKDCVCTEEPKGWLKVSTPNDKAQLRSEAE